MYSFCNQMGNTGICGSKIYVNGILIPDSATQANQSMYYTCSQQSIPSGGKRGCTDDNSVPIVREINFANSPSFGREYYPQSTMGENITDPPAVIAVKLVVTKGGASWGNETLQIGPGSGASNSEGVISRCRGRFDAAGRETVLFLRGYIGAENQSTSTFFASWNVDHKPIYAGSAQLTSPGSIAPDGWLSDGIYYVNIRQFFCSGSRCERQIIGSGVPYE